MNTITKKVTSLVTAMVLCLGTSSNVIAAENAVRAHAHSYGERYYRTEQQGSYTHQVAIGIVEGTHEVIYGTCTVMVEYEYYERKCTYSVCKASINDHIKIVESHGIDQNTEWWLN